MMDWRGRHLGSQVDQMSKRDNTIVTIVVNVLVSVREARPQNKTMRSV